MTKNYSRDEVFPLHSNKIQNKPQENYRQVLIFVLELIRHIKREEGMTQSTSFEPQTSGAMGFDADLEDSLAQSVSFNIEHDVGKTPPAL